MPLGSSIPVSPEMLPLARPWQLPPPPTPGGRYSTIYVYRLNLRSNIRYLRAPWLTFLRNFPGSILHLGRKKNRWEPGVADSWEGENFPWSFEICCTQQAKNPNSLWKENENVVLVECCQKTGSGESKTYGQRLQVSKTDKYCKWEHTCLETEKPKRPAKK
jgi:hypothetical protein